MFDIIIIGAGINGALLARELSKYHLKIAILDKENDVANAATSANSGIIHSGHEPQPNTLKAQLNVRAQALWDDLTQDLNVEFQRNGAFVVAVDEAELDKLHELYDQAQSRAIPSQILNRNEALSLEPNLSEEVIEVLDLPTTGIISPWELTVAAIEDAVHHGVELFLNHEVLSIDSDDEGFIVNTQKGVIKSRWVINSAGVFADDIYAMVSPYSNIQIQARRGEYYVLDRSEHPFVSRTIYPIPTDKGKGVLVVPTIHKNILIGPNAERIMSKEERNNTADGLAFVEEQAKKTVKNIPFYTRIRTFAGIRASLDSYDFIIEEAQDVPYFINLIGIDSPGLASAPAICEYVIESLIKPKEHLIKKVEERSQRQAWTVLNRKSLEEKQALFNSDHRYGKMVCRCELISEAEIIESIHRNAGAHTLKSVKRRTRAGTGRCQGSFCEPRIVEILSRELNIKPNEVVQDHENSAIIVSRTKESNHENR